MGNIYIDREKDLFFNSFYYAPIGMALVGLKGEWLEINPALSKIVGYEESDLLSKTFQDITHPEDLELDLNYVNQMISREIETYRMVKRYFHKDGHIVWVLLSVSLVHDMDENPLYFISQIVDITEQKLIEAKLREGEERFRLIAEHSTDMISKHTKDGIIIYISPACKQLLGYDVEDLIGKSAYEYYHPEDFHKIQRSYQSIIRNNDVGTFTYRCMRKDGSFIWFETTSQTIRDANGKVQKIIAVTRDVSERKAKEFKLQAANKMLRDMSETDGLTGIPNRRFFDNQYKLTYEHCRKNSQNLAVILLDVDYFKKYNDTYGHLKGDDCLRSVAQTIQQTITRHGDFVARYGGEEFVVVLSDVDQKQINEILKSIRNNINQMNIPHEMSNVSSIVTVSGGCAIMEANTMIQSNILLDFADKALYRAKHSGRNSMKFYN
jgi:diguanylate cyclase (GGDEF)-like protein/PAS domain S-box-containing protein